MSFVPLKFEYGNYYFQFRNFYIPFMNLQSIGFKFFAKIMKENCVFYCPSCISFNPKTHLKKVKNTVPQTYVIRHMLLLECFTNINWKKQIKKILELKK